MKHLYFILLFSYAFEAFAWDWQDLWVTRDQQGARYLQAQDYQKAQETFEHPEWRATAAYRAKNFDTASQVFGQLNTAEGYYNQGNAEAHLGHYQEALKSYKKSLKLRPQDPDTLHNKKIIEGLLEKQKSQSQSPDQNKDSASKKEQAQNTSQPQQTQNQNTQKQDPQNQTSEEPAQDNQKKNAEQNTSPEKKEQPSEAPQNNNANSENNQHPEPSTAPKQEAQAASSTSEKDQAAEQLLNMIPDDPSGLLRQKFLRDHRRRASGETS